MDVGLPSEQARAYVHLHHLGPSKVRRIAEVADLERSKTYRTLDALEEQGFVERTMESPTRYAALPIDEALGRLIEEQTRWLDRLAETRDRMERALADLQGSQLDQLDSPTFRTLQGRDAIHRKVVEIVQETSESLFFVSTHPAAPQLGHLSGIRGVVRELVEGTSVQVRSILRDEPKVISHLSEGPLVGDLEGAQTRIWDTERTVRTMIRDAEEVLIFAVSDPSETLRADRDVALWTDAPALVENQLAMFESAWERAQPLGMASPGP